MATRVAQAAHVMSAHLPPFRMPPLPTLGEILRAHNLRSKKQLSQHFLLDPRSLAKVVRAAGPLNNAQVVEVSFDMNFWVFRIRIRDVHQHRLGSPPPLDGNFFVARFKMKFWH